VADVHHQQRPPPLSVLGGGPAGFAELRRSLAGISDSVLSDRLGELTAAGLVQRTVEAGPPVSVAYALTPAGRALLPALDALARWAADNVRDTGC
jgi:DNA-binding HxlR family transcriptional regulator